MFINGLPQEAQNGDAEAQMDCYGLGDTVILFMCYWVISNSNNLA